jgi:hypothetical protein
MENYPLMTYLYILHSTESQLDTLVDKIDEDAVETKKTLSLFKFNDDIHSRIYQWVKVKAMVLLKGYKTSLKVLVTF